MTIEQRGKALKLARTSHHRSKYVTPVNISTAQLIRYQSRINAQVIDSLAQLQSASALELAKKLQRVTTAPILLPTTPVETKSNNWRTDVPLATRQKLVQKLASRIGHIRSFLDLAATFDVVQQLEAFWFQTSPSKTGYFQHMVKLHHLVVTLQRKAATTVVWEYQGNSQSQNQNPKSWTRFSQLANDQIEQASMKNETRVRVDTSEHEALELTFAGASIRLSLDMSFVLRHQSTAVNVTTGETYNVRCRLSPINQSFSSS